MNHSIHEFLESNAARHPEKIAVVYKGRKIDYGGLNKRSNQLARYLLRLGVKEEDLICIFLNKSIEAIVAMFAILKIGTISAILNPLYKSEQIIRILKNSNSMVIITDNTHYRLLQNAIKTAKLRILPAIINLNNKLKNKLFSESFTNTSIKTNPKNAAIVIFTSGSTGEPKGVVISNTNLYGRTIDEVRCFGISPKDRILNVLPISFDVGLNQILTCVYSGATLVLHNFLFVSDFIGVIKKRQTTGISGIPPLWKAIIDNKDLIKKNDLNSLRYITISGGSLSVKEIGQLQEIFRGINIIKTYGQTETFRSTILQGKDLNKKMDSIGKPLSKVKLIVVNKENRAKICNAGEVGELVHFGAGIMNGYLNDKSLTSRKIINIKEFKFKNRSKYSLGILTGDLVKYDKNGYFYYLGRNDEMIKVLGFRIYPNETENILLKHKFIKNAAVISNKINDYEWEIKAFVELNRNKKISVKELFDYCSANMPHYMAPKAIKIIDKMPLNPNMKIDKNLLRKLKNQSL